MTSRSLARKLAYGIVIGQIIGTPYGLLTTMAYSIPGVSA